MQTNGVKGFYDSCIDSAINTLEHYHVDAQNFIIAMCVIFRQLWVYFDEA